MTDGIIQQVIKKKRIPYDKFNIATQMREFNKAQDRNMLLEELQQELIEKIKQEVKLHPRWPSIHIDILIGNNQE